LGGGEIMNKNEILRLWGVLKEIEKKIEVEECMILTFEDLYLGIQAERLDPNDDKLIEESKFVIANLEKEAVRIKKKIFVELFGRDWLSKISKIEELKTKKFLYFELVITIERFFDCYEGCIDGFGINIEEK
jgi:hypothetical protein